MRSRPIFAVGAMRADGIDAWSRDRRLVKQFHGLGKGQIGICRAQRCRRDFLESGFDDNGRCGGRFYPRGVLPVRDKREIAGLGFVDAGDATDIDVCVALQFTSQLFCDVSQFQRLPPG